MRKLVAVQPFLFAVYPPLSLLASNIGIVRPTEIAGPVAVLALATGMLLLVARLLLDGDAAAVVVSFFWVLFFNFEPCLDLLGVEAARMHWLLLPPWMLVFVLVVIVVRKRRGRLRAAADILTVTAVVLVTMPAMRISASLITRGASWPSRGYPLPPTAVCATAGPQSARGPNVFYIVLDGYARADVLEEYGYDNGLFLESLTDRGFYVAGGSRANYCQTYLSVASSLNARYLDDVVGVMGPGSDDRGPLREMVARNAVSAFLGERGYRYVAVGTGYFDLEMRNADAYNVLPGSPNEFQTSLLGMIPVLPHTALLYEMHRQRLVYAFNRLADVASSRSPVFVFAHILAPHPPYVFGEHGERINPDREFSTTDTRLWRDADAYVRQLAFINTQLVALVDAIIAGSPEPPIIVLQSDHGPAGRYDPDTPDEAGLRERLPILNAYYLPGAGGKQLYDGITPVNTFRIILSEYFGADCELVKDRSYYSSYYTPYKLREVPAY